jgi:hypothetical protein
MNPTCGFNLYPNWTIAKELNAMLDVAAFPFVATSRSKPE